MKNFFFVLLFALFFSSCNQYKRFTYLQAPLTEKDSVYSKILTPYKIQPSDNLYIKISSAISKTTEEMFNSSSTGTSSMSGAQGGSLYLMGYVVNQDGCINLPVLGIVQVSGYTVGEVQSLIQEKVTQMSSDARVDVKLLSFKISILGEIGSPGQFTIFSDRATILEALAMAGDITYNGNRKKILILRSYTNGTLPIEIDLTQRSILKSENYFLMPNDIIYIEPYKTTAFRLRIADYSQFLMLITSTITAVLLINNAVR